MNSLIETLNRSGDPFLTLAGPVLVQSSIVIAVLFALDWLWRDRVRAVVRHAVWLLALIKLLLPPSLALPTSPAYWLRAATPPEQQPVTIALVPAVRRESLPLDLPVTIGSDLVSLPPRRTPLTTAGFLGGAWLAVVLALIACVLQRARAVTRVVRRARPAPAELNQLVADCSAQLNLRHRLAVRITDAVPGPALCGLFRPVILMPSLLAQGLSALELRAVLVHELAHFKRGDLWINHAQTLLQIVFWFHPLLWLANSRIRRVREEAVDEAVLAVMGHESDSYPDALLQIGKFTLTPVRGFIGIVGIIESRSALARRIERLLRLPFEPRRRLEPSGLVAVLLCALVLLPMASAEVREAQTRPFAEPGRFTTSPQVAMEVKWIEIKTPTNQPSPLAEPAPKWSLTGRPAPELTSPQAGALRDWPSTNAMRELPNSVVAAEVLAGAEFNDFLTRMVGTSGAEILTASRVATLHEQAAEIDATEVKTIMTKVSQVGGDGGVKAVYHAEVIPVGPRIRLVPSVSKDLKLINLTVDGTFTEFLGYREPLRPSPEFVAPHPTFQQRRLVFNADLKPGESLILAGEDAVTLGKAIREGHTEGTEARRTLLLLVTPRLIDANSRPIENPPERDRGPDQISGTDPMAGAAVQTFATPTLVTRVYQIDRERFAAALRRRFPGPTPATDATNLITMFQECLIQAGVSFEDADPDDEVPDSKSRKAIFFSDTGRLFLRLKEDEMKLADPLIAALNAKVEPINLDETRAVATGRDSMPILRVPRISDCNLNFEELTGVLSRLESNPKSEASSALRAVEEYYNAHRDSGVVDLVWLKRHWTPLMAAIVAAQAGGIAGADHLALDRLGEHIARTTSARERIRWKLATAELADIEFRRETLSEVVRRLVVELRQRDLDRRGVNFIVNSSANTSEPTELNHALVVVPRQDKITAAGLLDAIVQGCAQKLQYSIEDYGVVFHRPIQAPVKAAAAIPPNKSLDSNIAAPVLRETAPASAAPAGGAQVNTPAVERTTNPGRANRAQLEQTEKAWSAASGQEPLLTRVFKLRPGFQVEFERALGESNIRKQDPGGTVDQSNEVVRRFLAALGLAFPQATDATKAAGSPLPTNGQKAVFFNDRNGLLFLRGTKEDVEIVEKALQVLNPPSQLITLEMQYTEVTDSEFQQLGLDGLLRDSEAPASSQPLTLLSKALTDAQFRVLRRALEQQHALQTPPRLTTTDGRQAEFPFAGITNKLTFNIGTNSTIYSSSVAVIPVIKDAEKAGQIMELSAVITLVSFLGYADPGQLPTLPNPTDPPKPLPSGLPLPRFRVRQALSSVVVQDGQTVLLVPVGFEPASQGKPAAKPDEKRFIIFVTPTLIDPAGNRIHPK